MRPSFQPSLVNGAFADPVLFLDFLFERRAFLFDCGNLRDLAARKLMRVSDLLISHAHMDHFADFDWLLRLMVGRKKTLRVYGPDGIIEHLEHKLNAYSWNLVRNYEDDFVIVATEAISETRGRRATFDCMRGFRRSAEEEIELRDGVLIDEATLQVRTAIFDHGIPCMGYCLEEKRHVNVWKNRLDELALPVGPWLHDLKQAVFEDESDDTQIRIWWKEKDQIREKFLSLGVLKKHILRIVSGQKIGYLVDVVYSDPNRKKVADLFINCDLLFIECAFLHEHADIARQRKHLTAQQAGEMARNARVRRIIPIHFSPRYADRESALRAEVEASFRGWPSSGEA